MINIAKRHSAQSSLALFVQGFKDRAIQDLDAWLSLKIARAESDPDAQYEGFAVALRVGRLAERRRIARVIRRLADLYKDLASVRRESCNPLYRETKKTAEALAARADKLDAKRDEPFCKEAFRRPLVDLLCRLDENGKSVADLATEIGISKTTVWRMLQVAKADWLAAEERRGALSIWKKTAILTLKEKERATEKIA